MPTATSNDVDKQSMEDFEEVVLADYSKEAFYPLGIQLSAIQQCNLSDSLEELYGRGWRKRSHGKLSAGDKVTFADERYPGTDTYGETMPESFLEVLWRVGARQGERFYDLGSGTGKLISIAWLLGLRSTGIELSHARCEKAWLRLAQLETCVSKSGVAVPLAGGLDCRCQSMMDVDLSDADIVFFCSTMYPRAMVSEVAKIASQMKPGSRIISYHNFDGFGKQFKEVGKICVATSWIDKSLMLVHEVQDT